jgi:peptide/nickel transport system substrate-binding protein
MLRTRRAVGSAAALAVASLIITACGSSSSGGNNPSPGTSSTANTTGAGFQKISQNGDLTGAVKGGTLNVLGSGDVDYMDPNLVYYTVGYMIARLYSRQLYTYPGVQNQQTNVVPDLATGAPVLSDGGKTETITIKQGAKWDTPTPTQVTAKDEILGVETTCNPSTPFGGTPDFADLIVGYNTFCKAFGKVKPTVPAIKSFLASASFPGVTVGSTPETVVFHLTAPATYFQSMLALTAFSPRSSAMLDYLPGSAQEAQHTISDGPYKIASYSPTKSIDLVRNADWDASTDTVRHAFVNEVKVTEGEEQTAIEQQIITGRADLSLDTAPTPQQANQLITKNDPLVNVQSEISSNPYLVWNTGSPNNSGALGKVAVRQALEYAINRDNLIQDAGGPKLAVPLTHVLPPKIDGAPQSTTWAFPYNQAKAKQLLASAGASHLTLKFLYRPASQSSVSMFQDIQNQLSQVGVTVKGVQASNADFYVKYLEKPSSAQGGAWDVSLAGWGPDWYGNAALSFFKPLFDGRVLPPLSSNFGLFDANKTGTPVENLIDQAATATDLSTAEADWTKADDQVIQDAAIFPIEDPNEALVHAPRVHNDVYIPAIQNFDFANLWLSGS